MAQNKESTFEDLLHELNKDPEFREDYRRVGAYYELIREVFNRRKHLGWTQKKLAEEAGTYQANVSRIESGEYDARLSTIIELAEAMDTRVEIRFIPILDNNGEEAQSNVFIVPMDSSPQPPEYSIPKVETLSHTSRTFSY